MRGEPPRGRRGGGPPFLPEAEGQSDLPEMDIIRWNISFAEPSYDFRDSEEVEGWEIGAELGSGLCGVVKEAKNKEDGKVVALKIINIDKLEDSFRKTKKTSREELLNAVQTEAKILQTLTHPNIVAFVASFSFSSCEYLAMELVEGVTLRNLIPFSKGILEQRARDLFQQIGEAVRYCHSMQIIHGDIKPSNILVENRTKIKLTDFGFSHFYSPSKHLTILGGTLLYSPPKDATMTPSWDCWSSGVVLYLMVTGMVPFRRDDLIHNEEFVVPILPKFSEGLTSVLRELLNPSQLDRLPMDKILANDWFCDNENLPCPPVTIITPIYEKKPRKLPLSRDGWESPTSSSSSHNHLRHSFSIFPSSGSSSRDLDEPCGVSTDPDEVGHSAFFLGKEEEEEERAQTSPEERVRPFPPPPFLTWANLGELSNILFGTSRTSSGKTDE